MIVYCQFCNRKFEKIGQFEHLINAHKAHHEKSCKNRGCSLIPNESAKVKVAPELTNSLGGRTEAQDSNVGSTPTNPAKYSTVAQLVVQGPVKAEVDGSNPSRTANIKLEGNIWHIKRQGRGLWFEQIPWSDIEFKKPIIIKDPNESVEIDPYKEWQRAIRDTDRHTKSCKNCGKGKLCEEGIEFEEKEKNLRCFS